MRIKHHLPLERPCLLSDSSAFLSSSSWCCPRPHPADPFHSGQPASRSFPTMCHPKLYLHASTGTPPLPSQPAPSVCPACGCRSRSMHRHLLELLRHSPPSCVPKLHLVVADLHRASHAMLVSQDFLHRSPAVCSSYSRSSLMLPHRRVRHSSRKRSEFVHVIVDTIRLPGPLQHVQRHDECVRTSFCVLMAGKELSKPSRSSPADWPW